MFWRSSPIRSPRCTAGRRATHQHARLVRQPVIEPAEQGAAAGERDAVLHDVRSESGSVLSRVVFTVSTIAAISSEITSHVLVVSSIVRGRPEMVAGPRGCRRSVPARAARPLHLDLDLLGGALADRQGELLLHVLQDRVVRRRRRHARTAPSLEMPPREMTATSVVPPPMSTTMLPDGSCTGRSAPITAAIGSSMMCTGLPRPGVLRGVLHGTLSDPRDPRRDADHHPRLGPAWRRAPW